MTTFQIVAMYYGAAILVMSGIAFIGALLVLICDLFGNQLWRKLTALHALYVLKHHLDELRKRGRVFIKPEANSHD